VRDLPDRRETLRYLAFSGRPKELIDLVEAYAKEQGLWHDETPRSRRTPTRRARPRRRRAVAGRARSARRTACRSTAPRTRSARAGRPRSARTRRGGRRRHDEAVAETFPASDPPANGAPGHEAARARRARAGRRGRTVVAERSDTAVEVTMTATSLQARPRPRRDRRDHVVHEHLEPDGHARAPGLLPATPSQGPERQPWVKTSLAPGSKVVTEYLERAGLDRAARRARLQPRRLRLHDVHRELRGPCPTRSRPPVNEATSRSARS
jgi:aconitate hydratase